MRKEHYKKHLKPEAIEYADNSFKDLVVGAAHHAKCSDAFRSQRVPLVEFQSCCKYSCIEPFLDKTAPKKSFKLRVAAMMRRRTHGSVFLCCRDIYEGLDIRSGESFWRWYHASVIKWDIIARNITQCPHAGRWLIAKPTECAASKTVDVDQVDGAGNPQVLEWAGINSWLLIGVPARMGFAPNHRCGRLQHEADAFHAKSLCLYLIDQCLENLSMAHQDCQERKLRIFVTDFKMAFPKYCSGDQEMSLRATKDGDVKVKILTHEIQKCADPAIAKASKKFMMKTSFDPREWWKLVDLVEVLASHHGLHCILFQMLGELIQPFDKRIHNECWPTMKASSSQTRPKGKVLGKISKDSAALVKEWKLYDRNRMILRYLKSGNK